MFPFDDVIMKWDRDHAGCNVVLAPAVLVQVPGLLVSTFVQFILRMMHVIDISLHFVTAILQSVILR